MNTTQDDFAALRYRDFSIVTLNQFCLTLAILIQEIIVAYSLYKITKDPLTLGLIGFGKKEEFKKVLAILRKKKPDRTRAL